MSFWRIAYARLPSIAAMLAVLLGLTSQRSVSGDDGVAKIAEAPKHFILNPDYGRPAGYPAEIPVDEFAAFVKTLQPTGQGCGGMTWEGKFCGFFCNTYAKTQNPWIKIPVELDASYAKTKTGTFLTAAMVGKNSYRRADRTMNNLVWNHNYEPEYEQQAIHGILLGSNSAKRKELLTKIKDSFHKLDLAEFSAASKKSLSLQVQHCENDPDSDVVKLANEIRTRLVLPEKIEGARTP